MQWNAGTACVSECVLKTLACRGLRVGPSKVPRTFCPICVDLHRHQVWTSTIRFSIDIVFLFICFSLEGCFSDWLFLYSVSAIVWLIEQIKKMQELGNSAIVIELSLVNVVAVIRINGVRQKTYQVTSPNKIGIGLHRPCIRCTACRIARLAFTGVTFSVPRGLAEIPNGLRELVAFAER